MADYRYLSFPEKCRKMNCLIQVSLLGNGKSPLEVKDTLKLKTSTLDLGKLKDIIESQKNIEKKENQMLQKYTTLPINGQNIAKFYGITKYFKK